jgi:hypothetical protein
MQIRKLYRFWRSSVFIIIFLFIAEGVFSQQVIWLKNGKKYTANVKFRTNDTLVYVLPSNPKMEHWVLMKEVDNIQNLNPMNRILWDTLPEKRKEELYLQNKNLKGIGVGFAIGGAIVAGAGLIVIIPAALKDFNHVTSNPDWVSEQLTGGIIVCAIGTVSMLTGVILVSTSNSKMKRYAIKHHKLAFDFKFTPTRKGFSLVYRF